MSIINFLDDLGIIANKDTPLENDPNLIQGQEFMYYERVYANNAKKDLELLELTSSPNLESIIETLDNGDSTNSNKNINHLSISSMEDEFNRTLVKYNTAYKYFMENNISKNTDNITNNYYFKSLQRLNNKLISLAKIINSELSKITVTDNQLKRQFDLQQQKLNSYISSLNTDKQTITGVTKDYNTISGLDSESKISMVSNKYNYIVWFILAITIVVLIIHISASGSVSNAKGSIILVISLIILYYISQNIFRNISQYI
jgi:hypothetical protein